MAVKKRTKLDSIKKKTTTTVILIVGGLIDVMFEAMDQLLDLMNLDEDNAKYIRAVLLVLVLLREKIGDKLKRVFAVQIRWYNKTFK